MRVSSLATGALGAGLLFFLGWEWNSPVAAWLAPVFLIRSFRTAERWTGTLLVIPLMVAALWLAMTGRWPLPMGFELGINVGRALPFLVALYADRFLCRRVGPVAATLVYPASFTIGDYLFSLGPMGSAFSPAATLFSLTPLVQLVSVTGIWGLSFLTGWFAATVNVIWQEGFDLRAARRPALLFAATLATILIAGSLRTSGLRSDYETVRIASVAIDFESPYWGEIAKGNPPEGSARLARELAELHDRLFDRSERAALLGAKVVFWGEGNAAFYLEDEPAFVERARDFAREHGIYFAPAILVLHPGEAYAENRVLMIDPSGEVLFSYEKTKTPKKTLSDGVLPVADTPYGRIAASICFDMDYPSFANQLGGQGVDIMLVPSWDRETIKPFHTEVGAFRAVENGFASVRGTVKGTSMAVDYTGRVIAYQDFFTVEDATMIADVPTQGVTTLYGLLGDWFVYACALYLLVLVGRVARTSLAERGDQVLVG